MLYPKKNHITTATSYHDLGTLYEAQSNHKKAITYYTKALNIREKALGEEHPNTIESREGLKRVQKRFEKQDK